VSNRHRIKYGDSSHALATDLAADKGVPTAATCALKDKAGEYLLNGIISTVGDLGTGDCTYTYTGHAVGVGDVVLIAGTGLYDSSQTVTAIDTGTFTTAEEYVAPASGTFEITAAAATVLTATTLGAAASAGEASITLAAVTDLVEGYPLRIAASADGRHEDVRTMAIGAAVCKLDDRLRYDHTTATAVTGRRLSYAVDASQSEFTSGLDFTVIWEITNTDDVAWREDAEVLKRELSIGGLEARFKALYPHYYLAIPANEFGTYEEAAFDDLRALFKWTAQRDIDKLVNPDDIEPVLIRQIAFSIAMAGDDAWKEERLAMKTERDDWLARMSKALIWVDTNQDDIKDDSEVQAMMPPIHRRRLF